MPLWVRILLSGILLAGANAAPGCGCGSSGGRFLPGAPNPSAGGSSDGLFLPGVLNPFARGSSSGNFLPGVPSPYGSQGSSPGYGGGALAAALSSKCPPQIIINNDGSYRGPDGSGSSFPVTIEEPVLPVGYSQPNYAAPDPFTGRKYGLSMVAPPPAGPAPLASLGALDADIEDVIPGSPYGNGGPGSGRPKGPSMNIQIQPAGGPGPFGNGPNGNGPYGNGNDPFGNGNGPYGNGNGPYGNGNGPYGPYGPGGLGDPYAPGGPLGPAIPLGELPVQIQEPIIPYSGNGDGDQGPEPVKLLTGLNARLDRIVLPASDLVTPQGPSIIGPSFWHGSTGCAACSC